MSIWTMNYAMAMATVSLVLVGAIAVEHIHKHRRLMWWCIGALAVLLGIGWVIVVWITLEVRFGP